MSTFDPTSLLAPRATQSDEGAIIRMAQKTRELRAKGKDVAALTLGEPDFDTPLHIQRAATEAMLAGHTHYSPVAGLPELRQALAAKFRRENGLAYAPEQITVGNGLKQVIANAILSLVAPGDEVILLAPYWVAYEMLVRLAGGTPVVLKAGVEEAFKVPAAHIAGALTNRTKLLILNSPNNPTGAVWTAAELEAIAAVVRAHPRLMVLADEIYEYILFDGAMSSFAACPGMMERTVTLNGFSKGFAMTGWRLGYAGAPEPVAKAMARMQSAVTAGANPFVQRAGVAALEGSRDEVIAMRERYRARRDMVVKGLSAVPGVKLSAIPATFYAFPDVSDCLNGRTVDELCDLLVEEFGVATVPGSGFGDPACIRLSFAASESVIEQGLERLARGLAYSRSTSRMAMEKL